MSIADTLSDTEHNLCHEIFVSYSDELTRLPLELKLQLFTVLYDMQVVRKAIDKYQVRKVTS